MGKIQKETPVKLICGFISSEEELFDKAALKLSHKFGKIDFESNILNFDYTNYYEYEMGRNLKRRFISLKHLIYPRTLSSIKRFTNNLETKFLKVGKRRINIDPGYLNSSKLVLATTKDYSHRIYLSKGIFAELTLNFRGKSFKAWQWTYPDYKTEAYLQIFNQIRLNYLNQIKH